MREQYENKEAKRDKLNRFAVAPQKVDADGMYDPAFEHDNCGIGAVVNIKGIKTHATVENALKIVENLKHRAGKDAEGKPVTVLVSCFRFPTNSFPRLQNRLELNLERKEITVSECFSSRKTS